MFSRLNQDHAIMVFLLLVALASGADLLADLSEGVDTAHILQEGFLMLIAGFAFLWISLRLRASKKATQQLEAELESVKSMDQPKELLVAKQQLSKVISSQFAVWKLSKSEQDVGLLLLKGFSLKEIASLRNTTEKTIRQQASSVYKKSGLSGRHAFSAWFLEDLL